MSNHTKFPPGGLVPSSSAGPPNPNPGVVYLGGGFGAPPPLMEYRVRYWTNNGVEEQATLGDPESEAEAHEVAETIRFGCQRVVVERRPAAPWERVVEHS